MQSIKKRAFNRRHALQLISPIDATQTYPNEDIEIRNAYSYLIGVKIQFEWQVQYSTPALKMQEFFIQTEEAAKNTHTLRGPRHTIEVPDNSGPTKEERV